MSTDNPSTPGLSSRLRVILHLFYWLLEWGANGLHLLLFLFRRRRIRAEMTDLIIGAGIGGDNPVRSMEDPADPGKHQ